MAGYFAGKSTRKVVPALQFYRTLANIVASHPRLQQVIAGRKVIETISARCIGLHKVGCLEDQDRAAHSLVNFAMDDDHTGLVEDDRSRLFVFAESAQIKSLGFRVGKDVVIGVVHVREVDRCADEHRKEVGRERDVLLRHFERRSLGVDWTGTQNLPPR